MNKERPNRGIDAIVYIDDKPVGGQKNCILNRMMTPINITNKITGEWSDSIAGLKSWNLTCQGMFIKDEESFDQLEQAFYNGEKVKVKMSDNSRSYEGEALIVNFPITATYNDTFAYSVTFTGAGELKNGTN